MSSSLALYGYLLQVVVMGGVVRQPGWFRLMRAGVFASVCVVLSAVGHDLMATGRTPLWAGFAALGVLVPVGYSLAGRRRSALGLLLAVEAVQLGLHALFSWATPVPAPMPGMVMTHSSGAGMFGVHALAGALVAGWLYVGDRALWWALAVLVEPVRRACAVLCTGRQVRVFVVAGCRDRKVAAPGIAVLRHVVARRGPPRVRFVRALV